MCAYEYGRNIEVDGIPQKFDDVFYYCSCNYKPERKWPKLKEEIFYYGYNCDNAFNHSSCPAKKGCYYEHG